MIEQQERTIVAREYFARGFIAQVAFARIRLTIQCGARCACPYAEVSFRRREASAASSAIDDIISMPAGK
jgi:hypothetical protein